MGKASRAKPKRLAEKLLKVRLGLDLSQNEILSKFNNSDRLTRVDISRYERGIREPSLLILLDYAQLAGISTDILIDDGLELPKRFGS